MNDACTQRELPLAAKRETRTEAIERKQRHVFLLESILMKRTHMPWMLRREIVEHVRKFEGMAWDERYVRQLASMSAAICSGPGSPGYAFADLLSVEELEHTGRTMMSQGRGMFKDGVRYMKAAALKRKTAEVLAPMQDLTAKGTKGTEDAKSAEHDEALRRYMAGEDLP